MKKVLILVLSLLLILPLFSANFKKGKFIEVNELKGDLYAIGEEMVAKGIDGDVFFLGRKSNLWDINGGVSIAGEKLTLNGTISRSVRFFGRILEVNGTIGGDILFAGQELRLERGSVINGNVYAGGEEIDIYGQIKGNLKAGGEEIIIGGTVEGNTEIRAKKIVVLPEAKIKGKLDYWAPQKVKIPEGAVAGTITFHKYTGKKKVEKKAQKKEVKKVPTKKRFFLSGLWFKISWFISSLILGYLLFLLFPSVVRKLNNEVLSKPIRSFLLGSAGAVVFVVLIILFFLLIYTWLINLVTLPIFIIGLYLGKLLGGLALGFIILKWIFKKEVTLWISYPVGLLLLIIISLIPYIGWILLLVIRLWGFGGFFYKIKI